MYVHKRVENTVHLMHKQHTNFFFVAQQSKSDLESFVVETSRSHTTRHTHIHTPHTTHHTTHIHTHHTPCRTPLYEQSARPKGRYLHNTQHTQTTNIHTLGWIQTRDPSNRAAACLRLRPHVHRDRHTTH